MAKILVVEDDDSFREVLADSIRDIGHAVEDASDGEMAIELLQNRTYDLIISDVQMPLATGVELLAWVKQNIKTPIVLITGFSYIMNSNDAKGIGAAGFLRKPFDYKSLVSTLDRLLPAV